MFRNLRSLSARDFLPEQEALAAFQQAMPKDEVWEGIREPAGAFVGSEVVGVGGRLNGVGTTLP